MAKRKSKQPGPGSPGIFLRIPEAIGKKMQRDIPPNGKAQTVILRILADHYEVTEPLPTRGGQKKSE